MLNRITYPLFKAFTDVGELATGYKLYTYAAGTTTPITTYSNVTLTTPNTNPIILDVSGEAVIYCANSLKLTLTDEDDVIQTGWPVDNITPFTVSADVVSYDNTINGSLTTDTVQEAIDELIGYVDTTVTNAEFSYVHAVTDLNAQDGIDGGDMFMNGANTLQILNTSCLDSTRLVPLYIDTSTAVDVPDGVSAIYNIYICRRIVDGVTCYKVYLDGLTDQASSDATIDAYRWLGMWQNKADGTLRRGYLKNGTLWYTLSSENIFKTTGAPPAGCETVVSIASIIPLDRNRVSEILLGSQAATAIVNLCVGYEIIGATGMVHHSFSAAIANLGDDDVNAWYLYTSSAPQWMPLDHNNADRILWGDGTLTNTGTADLRIHALKLRR